MLGIKKKSKKMERSSFTQGQVLSDSDLKLIIGSGNNSVRFIPDEYLQTKILNDRM